VLTVLAMPSYNNSHPGQTSVGERDPGPITTEAWLIPGWSYSTLDNKRPWLWVHAFAGTTTEYGRRRN